VYSSLRRFTVVALLVTSTAYPETPAPTLFGDPQRVTIVGYDDDAMEPFLSRDGRYLLFNNLNEPTVNTNLHFAERIDDLTFQYRGELSGVNTDALEGVPTLDRENRFYFVSPRSYDSTRSTVYRGTFADGVVSAVELVPGLSRQEPGIVNFDIEVSADGETLYTVDARFGASGVESADFVLLRRQGNGFVRAPEGPALLANINTPDLEYAACISADGRTLLFTRAHLGALPSVSIFAAQRASATDAFGPAVKLEALTGFVEAPTFAADESAVYYHRKEGPRFVLYRARRWGTLASEAQMVFMAPTDAAPFPGPENPGGFELVVMNLDSSGREQLTHNQEQEFLPHFSPDGTALLYTRFLTGGYGIVGAQSRVTLYDFATRATRDLTDTGKDSYPVWSPDGSRIAFLSMRDPSTPGNGLALWVMNADGSDAHAIGRPSGDHLDHGWGDIAWSSQDWILFVVAENNANNTCFKTRLDKIRPDGTQRTQVTDGGPNCTPAGLEQNGDADPGYSADGSVIYTSRGYPRPAPGFPGSTVRKLVALSDDAWQPGKPERDLSLASAPECIEGVPKGSPDGMRILLFRACAGEHPGVSVTDTAGSYRTFVADGFGPDWNPALPDANQRGLTGLWFEPQTAGQGFGLEIYPDLNASGEGFLFGGWFTFDTVAGGGEAQRWYSLAGAMRTGSVTHALTIYRNTGGNFAAPPPTTAEAVGHASISFGSCRNGLLSYAFTDGSGRSGEIELTRATPNLTCAASRFAPNNADFERSGFWSDPTLGGQGIFVEINPAAPLAFLAWHTYAPAGQNLGAAGQRWYTAQVPYVQGARDIAMPLFETTGGVFDGVSAPTTQEVGSARLQFVDCAHAVLSYDFTTGSNAGHTGAIALVRSGPVPGGCRP
jgi:Tol biopolymer transport system component